MYISNQGRNIGMVRSKQHVQIFIANLDCKSNIHRIHPMHQCMIIHKHVHGKTKKELKRNPNLTYEEQTTSKQRNKDIYM